ncbi:transcription factor Sox-1-like [Panthera pardus]|uniref:Transcription factor Sox-1-like n=1 Tax=Panthera pardus TaxID=9691 RepID=A0A9V1GJJ4_PANPR|nr:transcription factor Sox-1-like [Panthera pardus]
MKALIWIGAILIVTACFSPAGAHKRKSFRFSESSEEHLKLLKQLSSKLSRGYFAKSETAPGSPYGHHGRHEPHRGRHPPHYPHHHQSPPGPPPRPISPPENTVNPQAPSAPSSAAPILIYTTATAAANTTTATVSAGKTAGVTSTTTAPNTPQPEDITNGPVAGTTTAPAANPTTVNQQQVIQ